MQFDSPSTLTKISRFQMPNCMGNGGICSKNYILERFEKKNVYSFLCLAKVYCAKCQKNSKYLEKNDFVLCKIKTQN